MDLGDVEQRDDRRRRLAWLAVGLTSIVGVLIAVVEPPDAYDAPNPLDRPCRALGDVRQDWGDGVVTRQELRARLQGVESDAVGTPLAAPVRDALRVATTGRSVSAMDMALADAFEVCRQR